MNLLGIFEGITAGVVLLVGASYTSFDQSKRDKVQIFASAREYGHDREQS